jgi:branched-chain amino acid aminotransferase
MNLQTLQSSEILHQLLKRPLKTGEESYLAHYSTYWNAILTDPRLLLIPVDDHMVHRGDGVFEALRLINNKFYLLPQHLERLRVSADAIGLKIPWSDTEITQLLAELAKVSKEPNLIFRLFVSRGSGSFSANPYDCPQPHLTAVACRFKPISAEKYQAGVKIGRSVFLQKQEPYCRIKSCNYLPNVLMKKESVDRKLDFVVSFSAKGFLAESSTENIFILSKNKELLYPQLNNILKGTTLERVLRLAKEKLQIENHERALTESDLINAREVFMIGTTLDILPVTSYENHPFILNEVGAQLLALIRDDQR